VQATRRSLKAAVTPVFHSQYSLAPSSPLKQLSCTVSACVVVAASLPLIPSLASHATMSLYSPMTEKDSTEELLHDCQSGDDDGTVYNIKARPALPTRWITTTVSLTAAGTLLGLLVGFLIGQSASRTSKASGLFHASFPASAPQSKAQA